MASLTEELDKFLNPTPSFQDPEDDVSDLTAAKIVEKSIETTAGDVIGPSHIRQKAALSNLSDLGEKYSGKKISRKKLRGSTTPEDEYGSENLRRLFQEKTGNVDGMSDDEEGSDEDEDGATDQSDDSGDIENFTSELNSALHNNKEGFSFEDDGDYSKYADNEDDVSDDDEDVSDDEEVKEKSGSGEESGSDDATDNVVKSFSKSNIEDDVEKGKATRQQLELWDGLLEGRIKMQKTVPLVNQLPQPHSRPLFQQQLGDSYTQATKAAKKALRSALDKLVQLQTLLLLQNTETEDIVTGGVAQSKSSDLDEEIPSDSDAEQDSSPKKENQSTITKTGMKRKMKMEEYMPFLTKRHRDFQEFRNNSIQKWYDKTRLAGGTFKSKSFGAFEQSAVKQIEQILSDRTRLIRRTQLKRTVYRVLGKEEISEGSSSAEAHTENAKSRVNGEDLQNHDPEIFDDDDFYHQLLRELIERKTSDTNDPVALSRQWLEIQKLRSKVKKKVDTRASKGRKIRYDVHPKLVNFMASENINSWSDESRNDLFKSLFGHRFQSTVDVSAR